MNLHAPREAVRSDWNPDGTYTQRFPGDPLIPRVSQYFPVTRSHWAVAYAATTERCREARRLGRTDRYGMTGDTDWKAFIGCIGEAVVHLDYLGVPYDPRTNTFGEGGDVTGWRVLIAGRPGHLQIKTREGMDKKLTIRRDDPEDDLFIHTRTSGGILEIVGCLPAYAAKELALWHNPHGREPCGFVCQSVLWDLTAVHLHRLQS